ncbi:MAG: metal ABC transporter ATP-binding protein [Alphaproteobacteria bacterium GM7ARS4]|nr:metal ABC transporter ATP-binding protein [Alphaproteobacteria bacterium GM7ARS4]
MTIDGATHDQPRLVLQHVSVSYHHSTSHALQDVSYHSPWPKKGSVAIIGPNGAGKSTLLKAILGLTPLCAGRILLNGDTIAQASMPSHTMKRRPYHLQKHRADNTPVCPPMCAYVPQQHSVDWSFPAHVLDVALMGMYPRIGFGRPIKEHHRQEAMHYLKQVQLQEHHHTPLKHLSGGQRQRLFIARALASKARLYLMDEPFSAIDAQGEKIILDVMDSLIDKHVAIFCVHHHLDAVKKHFPYVMLLNKTIIASGKTQEICTPATLQKAYLPT